MTHKQYMKEIAKTLKYYDHQLKYWQDFPQASMLLLIIQEKNDRLTKIAEFYHSQTKVKK